MIPASKESCINYQSLSKWCEIGIERSQHPNICTKLVTQFTAKDHPLCVCWCCCCSCWCWCCCCCWFPSCLRTMHFTTVNHLYFCNKDPNHSHIVCPCSFRSKPLPSTKRTCGERQTVLVSSQGCLPKAKFKQTMWTQLTACLSFYIDKAHRAATSSYKIIDYRGYGITIASLHHFNCYLASLFHSRWMHVPRHPPRHPPLICPSWYGLQNGVVLHREHIHICIIILKYIKMIFKCIYLSPP